MGRKKRTGIYRNKNLIVTVKETSEKTYIHTTLVVLMHNKNKLLMKMVTTKK